MKHEIHARDGPDTYSMPDIIFSYSSHHGTLAKSLARAMIASFFDFAGSILVVRGVRYGKRDDAARETSRQRWLWQCEMLRNVFLCTSRCLNEATPRVAEGSQCRSGSDKLLLRTFASPRIYVKPTKGARKLPQTPARFYAVLLETDSEQSLKGGITSRQPENYSDFANSAR